MATDVFAFLFLGFCVWWVRRRSARKPAATLGRRQGDVRHIATETLGDSALVALVWGSTQAITAGALSWSLLRESLITGVLFFVAVVVLRTRHNGGR